MKNNTFKRVLAGSLALLTVAAYMPANVGGVIGTDVALTAAAVDPMASASWADTVGAYIQSISDGTTTVDAETIQRTAGYMFLKYKTLTIESTIPLKLTKNFGAGDVELDKYQGSAEIDFEDNAGGSYINDDIYTETEANGVYTYKVLNSDALKIMGREVQVNYVNDTLTGTDGIPRGDGSYISLTEVEGADAEIVSEGKWEDSLNLPVKSETKISATKAFQVYVVAVDDPEWEIVPVKAVYDAETERYIATVSIPESWTDPEDPLEEPVLRDVEIYLDKVAPAFTFNNVTTKLYALPESNPTDAIEAASITATYQNKIRKDRTEDYYDVNPYKYDKVTNMETKQTVANGSRVELTFKNDVTGEMTSYNPEATTSFYTLKITRDGQELADNEAVAQPATLDPSAWATNYNYGTVKECESMHVPYTSDQTAGETTLSFTQTGAYVVTFTVYSVRTVDGRQIREPQVLTYEFTIDRKEALTANNVQLEVSGNINEPTGSPKDYYKRGIENGVVEIEVAEDWEESEIIRIAPEIFEETDFTLGDDSEFDAGGSGVGEAKNVEGTLQSNDIDVVNTVKVTYFNSEYGTEDKEITVRWKLVKPQEKVAVKPSYSYLVETMGAGEIGMPGMVGEDSIDFDDINTYLRNRGLPYFTTTVDKKDTFEEDFREALDVENAEPGEIEFEYVAGYGATLDTEELDFHETGLPSQPGEYTVYAVYDGELLAVIDVLVEEHALYASLTDEQTHYTYGTKKLTSNDIVFEDVDGNPVKDAGVKNASISYYPATKLSAAEAKQVKDGKYTVNLGDYYGQPINLTYSFPVFELDGAYYISSRMFGNVPVFINNDFEQIDGYLDAGVYVALITADDSTEVGKSGYAVLPTQVLVSVDKKPITADMVYFEPFKYDGTTKSPDNAIIVDNSVKDMRGDTVEFGAPVAGGTTSASAVGEYTAKVQVDENSYYGNDARNYTGTVNAKWHIVKEAKMESMTGLKFVDDKTTIYNNGQIHFEVTRPADSQFEKGVAQYGVIIEKNGKIPAPTKDDEGRYPRKASEAVVNSEFEYATDMLQVGNGFTEGKQSEKLRKENPTKYGANVAVVDVETGAWFRPYVIDNDGEIYYGDVIYVNLVQEATDALNLKLSPLANDPTAPTGAAGDDITSVVTKDDAKKDQPQSVLEDKSWRDEVRSGYSLDKNQFYVYGSYTLAKDSNVKDGAVQGFGVVVDKKGTFAPAMDPDMFQYFMRSYDSQTTTIGRIQVIAEAGVDMGDEETFDLCYTMIEVDEVTAEGVLKLAEIFNRKYNTSLPTSLMKSSLEDIYDDYTGTELDNALDNFIEDVTEDIYNELPEIVFNYIEQREKEVEDGLKLGNGFIEGKSGSNKMDIDEYGAMITPYNSVTGVWVRAYVDLGNGLVVYTKPQYITDQSSIFDSVYYDYTLFLDKNDNEINDLDAEGKWRYGYEPNVNPSNYLDYNKVTLKYAGVIVDKSGSFLYKDANGVYFDRWLDPTKQQDAYSKMIIGNGYIQGKKANNGNYYYAKVTPETYRPTDSAAQRNIPVVGRPYAIYDINGKEITVYGSVQTFYSILDDGV